MQPFALSVPMWPYVCQLHSRFCSRRRLHSCGAAPLGTRVRRGGLARRRRIAGAVIEVGATFPSAIGDASCSV